MTGAELDRDRLLRRLDELAAVGGLPDGGVTRLAYSPADVAGRDLVAGWMNEAGLEVEVDAAGNLIGRTARDADGGSGLPAIVMGSHLDTVVGGGRLDGAYGVVSAVEVAAALGGVDSATARPLVVVAFANEEGAAGSLPFDGSRAIAGRPNPLDSRDRDGHTLAERLAAAGGRPERIGDAAWPAGCLAAYLELHIEQGPVLDHEAIPLGVVTGITGRRNLDIVVTGAANHAGTTPMSMRRDALTAAAQIVLAVEALAERDLVRVATTGSLRVSPGARNVVPGCVELEIDLRDLDDRRLDDALVTLERELAELADWTGVAIACELTASMSAAPTDPRLMELVERSAEATGLATLRLPSGAGHDAQIMAALGPIAMIFVPSRDGISHSSSEHTDPVHLLDGAEVLLRTVQYLIETPATH